MIEKCYLWVAHVARPEAHTFPHGLPLFAPDFNTDSHMRFSVSEGFTVSEVVETVEGAATGASDTTCSGASEEESKAATMGSSETTEDTLEATDSEEDSVVEASEAKRVCFLQMFPSAHVIPHGWPIRSPDRNKNVQGTDRKSVV